MNELYDLVMTCKIVCIDFNFLNSLRILNTLRVLSIFKVLNVFKLEPPPDDTAYVYIFSKIDIITTLPSSLFISS